MTFALVILSIAIVVMAVWLAGITSRLARLEASQRPPVLISPETLHRVSVLQGKRIGLHIRQDYAEPSVQRLLADRLEKVDARTLLLSPEEWDQVRQGTWPNPELDAAVGGEVECNNYRDVYFRAELNTVYPTWQGDFLSSLPAEGGRQPNLVNQVLKNLESTFRYREERLERQNALDELGI